MASNRLTISLQNHIKEKCFHKVFSKAESALAEEFHTCAMEAYCHMFEKSERDMMNNAPKGAFEKRSSFRVSFAGKQVYLNLKRELPFFSDYENKKHFKANSPVPVFYFRLVEKQETLTSEKKELGAKMKSLFASVTTVKKLLELWPEAQEFLPKEKPVAPPPTIIDINSEIDKFCRKYDCK